MKFELDLADGRAGGRVIGNDAKARDILFFKLGEFFGGLGITQMSGLGAFKRHDGPDRLVQFRLLHLDSF